MRTQQMRTGAGRWASVIGALLLVAACSPTATQSSGPSVISASTPSPTPTATPDLREVVHGWPDTSRNLAGLYSWDGSWCSSGQGYCVMGFMHNGYGSGDVEIRIKVVPGGPDTDVDTTAATVAGHDGTYRRIDAQKEEWVVDVEGTTIAIRLEARPGTSPTDLADARAIIGSMRTVPQDNDLGFRLVFRLTTDDWDSG